jgi:hypothetical protein
MQDFIASFIAAWAGSKVAHCRFSFFSEKNVCSSSHLLELQGVPTFDGNRAKLIKRNGFSEKAALSRGTKTFKFFDRNRTSSIQEGFGVHKKVEDHQDF